MCELVELVFVGEILMNFCHCWLSHT